MYVCEKQQQSANWKKSSVCYCEWNAAPATMTITKTTTTISWRSRKCIPWMTLFKSNANAFCPTCLHFQKGSKQNKAKNVGQCLPLPLSHPHHALTAALIPHCSPTVPQRQQNSNRVAKCMHTKWAQLNVLLLAIDETKVVGAKGNGERRIVVGKTIGAATTNARQAALQWMQKKVAVKLCTVLKNEVNYLWCVQKR